MIEMILSKERKARVWFDKIPHAHYPVAHTERRKITSDQVVMTHRRHCVLELLVPLGGRFNYGLLGCSMIDANQNSNGVLVDTTTQRKFLYSDSLAKQLEPVLWGLDEEFSEPVFEGVARGIGDFGQPDHKIHFDVAAHGDIGSSAKFFSRLGRLVIALAVAPDISKGNILNLLETCLEG